MSSRAVLFDLDNTLHDREVGLEAFVRGQHDELDLSAYDIHIDDWARRFVELDAKGRVWKDDVYGALKTEFGLRNTVAELLLSYETGFAAHVSPMPGLHETLRVLRERDWKIGIVTNGRTAFQTSTLRTLRIEDGIDLFVVSEACGLRKPDPRIFLYALDALGAKAELSWFVGDDPVADIAGASAVGMRTAWLRNGPTPCPIESDAEIAALTDFLSLEET